jgi:hypothetical protein
MQNCLNEPVLQILRQFLEVLIGLEMVVGRVSDLVFDAVDCHIDVVRLNYFVFPEQANIVHENFHLLSLFAHHLPHCFHRFVAEDFVGDQREQVEAGKDNYD